MPRGFDSAAENSELREWTGIRHTKSAGKGRLDAWSMMVVFFHGPSPENGNSNQKLIFGKWKYDTHG